MKNLLFAITLLTVASACHSQNDAKDPRDSTLDQYGFSSKTRSVIQIEEAKKSDVLYQNDQFLIDGLNVRVTRGGDNQYFCSNNTRGLFLVDCILQDWDAPYFPVGRLYIFSSVFKRCPEAPLTTKDSGLLECKGGKDCFCYYLDRPDGPDDEYGTGND